MSPCHNLEPSLVARDSSRLLSVKPNEWMHLSPFYTRMHGEWLRYAKSTSQFIGVFSLVRNVRGFQVNPLCRHDITSPFPPSGNGGYVRNLSVGHYELCRDDIGVLWKAPQAEPHHNLVACRCWQASAWQTNAMQEVATFLPLQRKFANLGAHRDHWVHRCWR